VGLLDNKTRIVDTILTQKGREQLSAGGLRPVFYMFKKHHLLNAKVKILQNTNCFNEFL